MDPRFTIIYDTYCGWCYGSGPIFDALLETGAEIETLHRHLFRGANAPCMADGKGAMVMRADAHISDLTGREFSLAYINNIVLSDSEILESGLTAQAAALVHDQGPEKEFAIRRRLETLRYIEGVSAQDRAAIVAALIAEGVAAEHAQKIGTPELQDRARAISDRAVDLMAQVRARGVPTIVKHTGVGPMAIDHAAFYGRPEQVASLAA